MSDLISQYKEGRASLRLGIRERKQKVIKLKKQSSARVRMEHEISLLEGMVRDMTEAIRLMAITYGDLRAYSEKQTFLMDPADIQRLSILATEYNPELEDLEDLLRRQIMTRYGSMMRSRMGQLTIKQRTTLERWIHDEDPRTMAEIAREDSVSRQAVWIRIFGDKTNRGALKTLRGEDDLYGKDKKIKEIGPDGSTELRPGRNRGAHNGD